MRVTRAILIQAIRCRLLSGLRVACCVICASTLVVACGGSNDTGQARTADDADADTADDQLEDLADCGELNNCVKACEDGDAKSCEWLGHMHETGDGAPQDYDQAAHYYDQACSGGRDEACAHLAMMYDIGLAVEEDPNRASELYEKACRAGNSWACNREQELQ